MAQYPVLRSAQSASHFTSLADLFKHNHLERLEPSLLPIILSDLSGLLGRTVKPKPNADEKYDVTTKSDTRKKDNSPPTKYNTSEYCVDQVTQCVCGKTILCTPDMKLSFNKT